MREFLEFHDSDLVAIVRTGDGVRLELIGYIHRWIGNKGTGWNIRTDILLIGGMGDIPSSVPIEISNGAVSVNGNAILGMIELPFEGTGVCQVTVQTVDGKTHALTGREVRVALVDEGTFVEMLPPEFNPGSAR